MLERCTLPVLRAIAAQKSQKTSSILAERHSPKGIYYNPKRVLQMARHKSITMNNFKRYLLLGLLLALVSTTAVAQRAKLRRANDEYKSLNFQKAIALYLEVLDRYDVPEAKINLADAYRKVGNSIEAEYWYGQIMDDPAVKPIYKLYYGQALQANGKCEEAKKWFKAYATDVPDDWRGYLLSQTCDRDELNKMKKAKNSFYEVASLPFNTKLDDFGPAFFQGGLVFASERDDKLLVNRTSSWTGNSFLDLFYVKIDTLDQDNFEYTYEKKPKNFGRAINTKFHDGPICFSPTFEKIYITRNNIYEGKVSRDDEGIVRLKIFAADLKGDGWVNEVGYPFNSDEYSVAHPAVTPDGRTMFFTSDMPGGFGGMDLYRSDLVDGRWSPPTNLGPRINTEGNELFPYYHESGKLFFASNGQLGLGGLDIYFVEDRGANEYGPVINMGAPVNSTADDFGILLNRDETFGYFSSKREGGVGGDDIYAFKLNIVEIEVYVYDERNGQPLANAIVYDACSETTFETDANGIVLVQMSTKSTCSFTGSMRGYDERTVTANTENQVPGSSMRVEIPLNQPLDFSLEGIVYDVETQAPIPDATVTLSIECNDGETLTAITNEKGEYRFLLDEDCCYRIKAEKEGYLADVFKGNICTTNKVASEIIRKDLNLTPYLVSNPGPNDVVVSDGGDPNDPNGLNGGGSDGVSKNFLLEHIYYDFNKYDLREESFESLDKLLVVLEDNPQIIVEIASHTDSRGENQYNKYLSRKRAKSVVYYLEEKGIPRRRLRYQGYGESQPTNGCTDGIDCTEEQHQRNRRTEFRVVGTLDGKSFSKASIPAESIRIDPCTECD